MLYGKRYLVGNYTVIKYNRVLRRQEIEQLRMQTGIPQDLRKSMMSGQLPYIKVGSVNGTWAIEFCCNTTVYRMIEASLEKGGERNESMLASLFNMWYTDTAIPGDDEYQEDKSNALKAFMERHKAASEVKEETAKVVKM